MASTNPSSQNTTGQAPDTSKPDSSGVAAKPARRGIRSRLLDGNRLHKVLIILLALGCITLYVWHEVEMRQVRAHMATEMTALQVSQNAALAEQANTSLRLAGHALGWGATQSLLQSDLAGIDAHITRMVKVAPVTLIAVIDQEGTVRVATNKKLEGQSAATVFPGLPLEVEEVTVQEQDQELVVVAPLMKDGNRIGSAVLTHVRPVGPAVSNDAPAR